MEELTQEQQATFNALQKPTMSLVASFYTMPDEVKELFADMLSIYEANPTEATAKTLSDKVMGDESAEDKKKWIKKTAGKVSSVARIMANKKYMVGQMATPKGVPTSGMLLVGLDVVSRGEKDTLMEAQAAARLISHVELLDPYQPKYDYRNPDGTFENALLDRPFATQMQRLEHLTNVLVNDIYTQCYEQRQRKIEGGMPEVYLAQAVDYAKAEVSKNIFLQKAYGEALKTLTQCEGKLKEKNPTAAQQIGDLARVLTGGKDAKEPLTIQDYKELKDNIDGHHAASMVYHRAEQIIAMKQPRQTELSKER